MKSEEIIIHYYLDPIAVMVDPGKYHPGHKQDFLLGWVYEGKGRRPILKDFPGAEIVAKTESKPKTYLTQAQQ